MTTLSIEPIVFYKKSIRYEITINPNDKHQYYGKTRRIELFVSFIQSCLKLCFDNYGIQYKLYLELSEPRAINKDYHKKSSCGARLHLHGWFMCPTDLSVGNYLLTSQYLLSRHSDVQINEYRKEWLTYCKKQSPVIKALAKFHSKVPYVFVPKMAQVVRRGGSTEWGGFYPQSSKKTNDFIK